MFVLFLIVFIDVMAFGVVIPLLPYLKFIYNVSNEQVGYLVSFFSLAALFGSIFWGMISDKYGRKLFLFLPLLISAGIYFITAFTVVFWQVVILRMISGFLTANFPVAFAAAADMTTSKNRFKAMATLGMAFSFGFVLGPTLGGYLAIDGGFFAAFDLVVVNQGVYYTPTGEGVNIALPFLFSAALALISGLLGIVYFKETLTKKDRDEAIKIGIVTQLKNIYTNKMVLFFSCLTIIVSVIFSGLEVAISLFLYDVFNFPVSYIGSYWACFAVGIGLSRYISMPLFGKPKLALVLGLIALSLGIFLLVLTKSIVLLIIVTALISWGLGIVMTVGNAKLSLEGTKNQQGTIFGINQLFGNFGRVIGPALVPVIYAFSINLAWGALSLMALVSVVLVFVLVKSGKIKTA